MLFSLTSKGHKQALLEELISCEKYLNLSREDVRKIPVWERKWRIAHHNDNVKREKEDMESASKKAKGKKGK